MHGVSFSFTPAAPAAERRGPGLASGLFGVPIAGPAPEQLRFLDTAWGLLVIVMVFAAAVASLSASLAGPSWATWLAAFTLPFGAPAFFMFAGILLRRSLEAPWPAYILRQVAPLVWRAVLFAILGALVAAGLRAFEAPVPRLTRALVAMIVNPPPMILLVEQLALCLIAARLLRGLRAVVVLPVLMALEIAHPDLGGPLFSGACRLLVYLYIGHIFAPEIRQLAKFAAREHRSAVIGLVAWAVINTLSTTVPLPLAGEPVIAALPFASLGLGLFGATAMIALAGLADSVMDTGLLRWIGARALGAWFGYFLLIEAWRAVSPGMPAMVSRTLLLLASAGAIGLAIAMARRPRAE